MPEISDFYIYFTIGLYREKSQNPTCMHYFAWILHEMHSRVHVSTKLDQLTSL